MDRDEAMETLKELSKKATPLNCCINALESGGGPYILATKNEVYTDGTPVELMDMFSWVAVRMVSVAGLDVRTSIRIGHQAIEMGEKEHGGKTGWLPNISWDVEDKEVIDVLNKLRGPHIHIGDKACENHVSGNAYELCNMLIEAIRMVGLDLALDEDEMIAFLVEEIKHRGILPKGGSDEID